MFSIEVPTWVWVIIVLLGIVIVFFLIFHIKKILRFLNFSKPEKGVSKKNINYGINNGSIGDMKYEERKKHQ